MFKLALDPGHGINTPGKRCLKSIDQNETREWWLNDRICNYVEQKLTAYTGYELKRVDDRTGQTDVSLEKRVKLANDWGADFYLSVHHNADIDGGKGGGIISIVYTEASEESKKYQLMLYNEMVKATSLKGNRSIPMPTQNLYVCRYTNMPAVLVECGFMDSTTDVPIILTEKFAEQCADGIINALVSMGKIKPKSEATQSASISFSDIGGHFSESAVRTLAEMGIINGKTKDKYMPDEMLTRGEFAVGLRRAIKYITGK